MRKTLVLSLFLVLSFFSSVAYGEDVAMVSAGIATATLDGQSWAVDIAEMLPENVCLKTDSGLSLIHLKSNEEYYIKPEIEAKVTADGVEGSDTEGESIKVVSENLELDKAMSNQTGAALVGLQRREISKQTEGIDSFEEIKLPSDSQSLESKENEHQKKKAQVSTNQFFALPEKLVMSFKKIDDEVTYEAESITQLAITENINDWTLFSFMPQEGIGSGMLELNFITENDSFHKIKLVYKPGAIVSVTEAWRLELNDFYAQAAGVWLKLYSQQTIEEEVLNKHLTRLLMKQSE
jgi:hypothetical protein